MPASQLSLLFIFLITVFPGAAQSFKEKTTGTVHISDSESIVVAEVFTKGKSMEKVDANKKYYWYKSNGIMSTMGGYDGKLLHGNYSSFYLDNNLKEKGKYKMGLKDGEWIKWNPNGMISEISNWKDGARNGIFQEFNVKQELMVSSHYCKDKLHGEVITYDSSKVVSRKKYKHGVEIVFKQKEPEKKEEKPEIKKAEADKGKEVTNPQDSTQNKKVPVKKAPSVKNHSDKKKK